MKTEKKGYWEHNQMQNEKNYKAEEMPIVF